MVYQTLDVSNKLENVSVVLVQDFPEILLGFSGNMLPVVFSTFVHCIVVRILCACRRIPERTFVLNLTTSVSGDVLLRVVS